MVFLFTIKKKKQYLYKKFLFRSFYLEKSNQQDYWSTYFSKISCLAESKVERRNIRYKFAKETIYKTCHQHIFSHQTKKGNSLFTTTSQNALLH